MQEEESVSLLAQDLYNAGGRECVTASAGVNLQGKYKLDLKKILCSKSSTMQEQETAFLFPQDTTSKVNFF